MNQIKSKLDPSLKSLIGRIVPDQSLKSGHFVLLSHIILLRKSDLIFIFCFFCHFFLDLFWALSHLSPAHNGLDTAAAEMFTSALTLTP